MSPPVAVGNPPPAGATVRDEVDAALQRVLRGGAYQNVYLGPWWDEGERALGAPGIGSQLWKRAVLRRRSSGGALHWGHLFLLERVPPRSAINLSSMAPAPTAARGFGEPRQFPLPKASALLIARPVTVDIASPLYDLAGEVARRIEEGASRGENGP
ncbi:MAG TPA: hypothetical protein VGV89_03790 [Thermoplasmata archaeon]|nr:hypothetical protein [Thermoplasmata archaeon]